jgi:hypothetical protein
MNIVYAICTNNHLAQAIVLGDSVKKYNPDYLFIICLVDKIDANTSDCLPYLVILVEDLNIPEWDIMNKNYNPFELCCALKPFFADHILRSYTNAESLIYFDSDIMVFNSLDSIVSKLKNHDIIITPHFLKNESTSKETELFLLRTGYFNGGFFAINNSKTAILFLRWWKERLINHGFDKSGLGMFVDQLWLNIVPYIFDSVLMDQSKNLNVAQWNYKYRKLNYIKKKYTLENGDMLIFFHLSDYKRKDENKFDCNIVIKTDPIAEKLYIDYNNLVLAEDSALKATNKCVYGTRNFIKRSNSYRVLKNRLVEYATVFLKKL